MFSRGKRASVQPTASGRRAAVVGSGPNGLTAAAVLAKAGWQIDIYEKSDAPGGAARSRDTLGPGTIVDLGAAGHPFGVASPIFRELELEQHGLEWLHSEYPLAHPLGDRPAAVLHRDLDATAAELGPDATAWRRIHRPVTANVDAQLENLLGPLLRFPKHPLRLAAFAPSALPSASALTRLAFKNPAARALFLGSAAHVIAPLDQPFTGAFGTLFGGLGQTGGWPVPRGGTQAIVDALISVIESAGGRIHTDAEVTDLRALPEVDATLLNLTPRQVLRLEGPQIDALSRRMRHSLGHWRYGVGAHKVDYLLSGPVPWADARVGQATTVHVAGSAGQLQRAESLAANGLMPEKPFVMVGQQQVADPSRASGPAAGYTVIWTYAHVPHGYEEQYPGEVAERIETQIERFAPGFRDLIVFRNETSPAQLEAWNPNLIGGDVAGGAMTGMQAIFRPGFTLDPYRLVGEDAPGRHDARVASAPAEQAGGRLYLCSASTPPGAGVHGMPGAWAARAALADFPSLVGTSERHPH
ncbi:phytoene desaturase family protein [Gulosibacter molinativorax]|uniref:NAD(P)/FAD-dependent oxidoreductase n=1 Tax=Gulosibacter molinativorax TaxID=256821 RepID=A0ABT7C9F5_9MICO|nr:NAD(P)/FAD-dependent oxidoreductase [Gulosibacter molinativorax]MDJ1371414.1 NAD(P)/FAD-dependent oxidoreductase [Gulosibacter molinativorax]QUY62911.1 Phytoene dehydrogenase-like oxidoreductase [Gulosibacter molinativorax]